MVVTAGMLIALGSIGPFAQPVSAQSPALDWSNVTPPASSPGNIVGDTAYDPATGQVILVDPIKFGSNTWAWDGKSWSLEASLPVDPETGWSSLLAYDAATSQLVLVNNDRTFVWKGWNWEEVDAAAPASISQDYIGLGESMAFDAHTGQLILIAGNPDDTPPIATSTWDWNGSTWTQLSPASSPGPRLFGSLAYDSADSLLVLFGGSVNSGYLSDTWTWDGSTWTQQSPSTSPPARDNAAFAYDGATSQLVMFGGTGIPPGQLYSGALQDTWTWDGTTWTSRPTGTTPTVIPGGPAPDPVSLSYDAESAQLVLFGGDASSQQQAPDDSDTWLWTGSDWSNATPLPTSPANGFADSMAYDNATSQMVSVVDGQTFEWTGEAWDDLNPSNSPPGYGLLAYDAATGELIWFEQNSYPGDNTSTWSWDGTNWQQLSPSSSPSPVDGVASLAYDTSSGQLVLVGAFGSGSATSEQTWTWDGNTWSKRTPASTPPALSDASMAYDPVTEDLILFGGFTLTPTPAVVEAATWAWNGATWTQLSPVTSPPPTADGAFAYDPAAGELLLFGGQQLCINGECQQGSDSTWAWDGTSWTRLVFPQNPANRSQAGLGWDPATQQMLLSGGNVPDLETVYFPWADTWALTASPVAAPVITSLTPGSGQVTVTWNPPTFSSGVDIGSYTITASPGGQFENVSGDIHSVVVGGLEQGVGYSFTVLPVTQAGTSPSSPPSAVVTPLGPQASDGPTNLEATCGDQSAIISWTPATPISGDGPVKGYVVTGPGGPITVGSNATSVLIPDLPNGTGPLVFFVSAMYGWGQTSGAESPSCTPYGSVGAPTLLSVAAGDQQVTVTWSPAQPEEGVPITGYEITTFYHGTMTVDPAATSAVVSGLTDGEGYFFTVSALTATGVGPPSAASLPVVPTPSGGVPTLTKVQASDQQVALTWLAPASKQTEPIVAYEISSSKGLAVYVQPSDTSLIVRGLSSGVSYTFSVAAETASGIGPPSKPMTAVIPVQSPGPPVAVSVIPSSHSATVAWSRPSSTGDPPFPPMS